MKAVILSAGQGKRLGPMTEDAPKCLLPLDEDTTILSWQLSQLAAAGLEEAVVVTGFRSDKVEAELARQTHLPARALYNPFYAVADNLASVWLAVREIEDDFLLMNGDTLFTSAVIERLTSDDATPITLTVSRKDHYDYDDMKVCLDGTRLTDVGKALEPSSVHAESIGVMQFRGAGATRFRTAVEDAMRESDALHVWYLSVLDRLAKQTPVMTAFAGPDEWCEIDFPADLDHGRDWLRRRRNGLGVRGVAAAG